MKLKENAFKNMKFYVDMAYVYGEEDSWKEGVIIGGKNYFHYDLDGLRGEYDSIDDFIHRAYELYGFPEDKDSWEFVDERLETAENFMDSDLTPVSEEDMKKWQNGEINTYLVDLLCNYHFGVVPSDDDANALLTESVHMKEEGAKCFKVHVEQKFHGTCLVRADSSKEAFDKVQKEIDSNPEEFDKIKFDPEYEFTYDEDSRKNLEKLNRADVDVRWLK